MNIITHFRKFKDNIFSNTKFYILTMVVPISGLVFSFHKIYKYKLYNFTRDSVFSSYEEKQIAKKLYPIIKYKNIEKTYESDTQEVELLSKLYANYISYLKLNLKSEIVLIKSDLIFLYILSTGSAFISDNLYYTIKSQEENKFELLNFIILHSILHVKHKHTSKNIGKIYSYVFSN
jgi:hypothetical protein